VKDINVTLVVCGYEELTIDGALAINKPIGLVESTDSDSIAP